MIRRHTVVEMVVIGVLALVLAIVGALSARAQGVAESYQVKYYAPGATAPMQQSDAFPASAVQCGQSPPAAPSVVANPTRVIWTDPANGGLVCIYTFPPAGALFALPIGSYEGTLTAANSFAASAERARAPFTRADTRPPGVPLLPRFAP